MSANFNILELAIKFAKIMNKSIRNIQLNYDKTKRRDYATKLC